MKYIRQSTNYNCVPASLSMVLGIQQEFLSILLGVTKDGITIEKANFRLKGIGCTIVNSKKNEIPDLVSYYDSKDSDHLAVVDHYSTGEFNEIFIHLLDPYYGKDIKYPLVTFSQLKPKYYRVISNG